MLKVIAKEILFCAACDSLYSEENKPYILSCGNTLCYYCVTKLTRVEFDKSDPSCHFDYTHHHILEDVPVNYMLLDVILNFKYKLMKKEGLLEHDLEDFFKSSKCLTKYTKKFSHTTSVISNTFRLTNNFANLDSSDLSFYNAEFKTNCIDIKTEKYTYVGNRKWGLMHGEGTYTCDEFSYSGIFENDVPIGKGSLKLRNINGEYINYEGMFQNFNDGEGVIFYPNGDRYSGKWKNLMKDGFGKFCLGNGDFYEGHFKQDLYNGPGEYYNKSEKKRSIGIFKDGKEEGEVIIFFENSNKPLKMLFKSGVLLTILEL